MWHAPKAYEKCKTLALNVIFRDSHVYGTGCYLAHDLAVNSHGVGVGGWVLLREQLFASQYRFLVGFHRFYAVVKSSCYMDMSDDDYKDLFGPDNSRQLCDPEVSLIKSKGH